MEKYHPMKDLAPRDVVARAIDSELKKSGDETAFLDLRHISADHIKSRFPNIYIHCLEAGIDITHNQIPVVPAAHYMCGGVVTDMAGHSNIERLYVCGETGCTGMHGANRLASNSLLEAVAVALFAADASKAQIRSGPPPEPTKAAFPHPTGEKRLRERVVLTHNKRELKRLMWDCVGIVRSSYLLEEAAEQIKVICHSVDRYFFAHDLSYPSIELRNMVTAACLIVECASQRNESRGLHYMTDYPDPDDVNWKRDSIIDRNRSMIWYESMNLY
jgi:L-aspartate oxidase